MGVYRSHALSTGSLLPETKVFTYLFHFSWKCNIYRELAEKALTYKWINNSDLLDILSSVVVWKKAHMDCNRM